ncbi:DUSAM domain-containing protein [Myxococcus sp. AM009]|uniref:DUSAM domain-containing protein n=1 Tax=unclassified Myxococcus TaxID=2648731 RepID=UPI0015958083|nr:MULTISPECIES: DUSAM domain-containing protein [unclassified Myxococcus]NVJ00344.1 DUSAM domain-containing protein [Myxococcus sp. AM009]NVJ12779.1 DUSAM domain-containing protein [Myxococcus sp. AM010]
MPSQRDWDAVKDLSRRITDPVQPFLTAETRALVQSTAHDVGIPPGETARALQNDESAAVLVKEIASRITAGSRRLSRTLVEVDRRRDAGDLDGARQLLNDVLAVEVVLHYQDIVHVYLEALDGEQ